MFFHSSPEYGAEFSRQDSRRGRRGEAGRVSERGLRAPLHDPRGRPDYSSANLLKTKRVDGQDGGIGAVRWLRVVNSTARSIGQRQNHHLSFPGRL